MLLWGLRLKSWLTSARSGALFLFPQSCLPSKYQKLPFKSDQIRRSPKKEIKSPLLIKVLLKEQQERMFKVQRSKVRRGADTPTDLSSSPQAPIATLLLSYEVSLLLHGGGSQHCLAFESLL